MTRNARFTRALLAASVSLLTAAPSSSQSYAPSFGGDGEGKTVSLSGTVTYEDVPPSTYTPIPAPATDPEGQEARPTTATVPKWRGCRVQKGDSRSGKPFGTCFSSASSPADAPAPITITASDVQTLIIGGSGLHRQPPGARARIDKPVIAYTSNAPRTLTTTVANTPVTVTAIPISYTWNWGDGTTTATTDPGAPWPNHTNYHYYARTSTGTTITLTTSWTATFTPDNAPTQPVNGTIATTETSTPFDVVRTITYLTDDAEESQGH